MNKSKDNLEKAQELKRRVEEWVDRRFNFIQLSVYEELTDNCLWDYIRETEDEGCENYPMWGTVFEWRSQSDASYFADKAVEVGFGIIEGLESFNTTLFIEGAGYSFFGAHWIPLYLSCYKHEAEKYEGVDYSMM